MIRLLRDGCKKVQFMNPKYLQKGAIYDAEFHLKVRRYISILYYA